MNTNFKIDELKILLENKKNNLIKNNNGTIEDFTRIQALEKLFNNDRCFFNISFETAINILKYIGVEESKIIDTYNSLTSYEIIKGEVKFK